MYNRCVKNGTKILLFLLMFTPFLTANAQKNVRIYGVVTDKLTQKPLSSVTVRLAPGGSVAISDSNGVFTFAGIPYATYNIIFESIGFKKLTVFNVPVNAGNQSNVNVELEQDALQLKSLTVKSNRRSVKAASLETPLSVQRLTTEEIKSSPGSNFDVSKVIQTLPGVGGGQQGGGFRNDIIIRGGAPDENVFYLDGVEIPVLNHFQTQGSSGGPQGLLNVSFIEDVKVSTSAFDARYDNAMSSVFQFKQRTGSPNKVQSNIRLSATELALTFEGPLSKNKKTTFLASARRSYLQLLFSALDLPIRPNYWDYQTKITHQLNKNTTVSFIGLGAIDHFSFAPVKNASPEKLYILNATPIINQWNYTAGITLRQIIKNGYWSAAISRNSFDNNYKQFQDNQLQLPSQQTLSYQSRETENKFRFDVNKNVGGWKIAFGAVVQFDEYYNHSFQVIKQQIQDSSGTVTQPAIAVNFTSPLKNFWRYGAFLQAGRRFFDNRVGLSIGIRTDMNSFTSSGDNGLQTLSPRISVSYVLSEKWTLNASAGQYFKIPSYTILGFANNNGLLVNLNSQYKKSTHFTAGVEYLPHDDLRVTVEGFYKKYAQEPVSVVKGISLANLGSDFTVLGNEAVTSTGKGRSYGFETFIQKKLTNRFLGILSYTFYRSEYSGANNVLQPSSWDNKHLLSITVGYKFNHRWEVGLKFRYQGPAAYTPFDSSASRANYLTLGQGVLDYSKLNTLRLRSFNASDLRIDKKWNFRKTTFDLFLDVTNWYVAQSKQAPSYTFKRTPDNKSFITTDGKPLKIDGNNAIPVLLANTDPAVTPTIGFVVEF